MTLAVALALPFEVYLTALSLEFLDLGEAGRRMVTLGIALSVALLGCSRHTATRRWSTRSRTAGAGPARPGC